MMRYSNQRYFGVVMSLSLMLPAQGSAEDGLATTVPDPASNIPRQEQAGQGLKTGKARANLTHSVALFLTNLINEYRLNKDTQKALHDQMPEIANLLRKSGAAGMLVEARFAAQTDALRAGDNVGPKNMTQRLLGSRLAVVGQGRNPNDVATLALLEEKKNGSLRPGAPKRDETVITTATRSFWISRNGTVEEADHAKLYNEAYLKANDDAYAERLQRTAYQDALDDMAHSLALNAESKQLRETAEDLLKQREKAKQDMVSINARLKEALDAATKANQDADRIALVAGIAGGASQVLSNMQSQPLNSQPSSATIELLKQKVEVETNMSTNATIIRSSAQRRSYNIWMNEPSAAPK